MHGAHSEPVRADSRRRAQVFIGCCLRENTTNVMLFRILLVARDAVYVKNIAFYESHIK